MTSFSKSSWQLRLGLAALALVGGWTGARLIPVVEASTQKIEVEGWCDRGDILVFEGPGKARCTKPAKLKYPRCDDGAFLTTHSQELECVGPSSRSWGVQGLLPRCDSDAIVVSEGFGKWKCAPRARGKQAHHE